MALTLFFLIASFSSDLPWATCLEEWGDKCVDSSMKRNHSAAEETSTKILGSLLNDNVQLQSSAELYFT